MDPLMKSIVRIVSVFFLRFQTRSVYVGIVRHFIFIARYLVLVMHIKILIFVSYLIMPTLYQKGERSAIANVDKLKSRMRQGSEGYGDGVQFVV